MMANQDRDKPATSSSRESELLPAILAIALAVAAQLALQDGLTLLGLAGYLVAAWLFVTSVRGLMEGAPARPPAEIAAPEPEATGGRSGQPVASANRLSYLRHNWRLVTLAEIFRGDIPPVRLAGQEMEDVPQAEPDHEPAKDTAQEATAEGAPAARVARLERWTAGASPASATIAVKVTPQGDVLVLDSGLGQAQRFDAGGHLLATYSLPSLAGLEIADLAVSPDGATVYVVDATSRHLQVIALSDSALSDDETTQEEE